MSARASFSSPGSGEQPMNRLFLPEYLIILSKLNFSLTMLKGCTLVIITGFYLISFYKEVGTWYLKVVCWLLIFSPFPWPQGLFSAETADWMNLTKQIQIQLPEGVWESTHRLAGSSSQSARTLALWACSSCSKCVGREAHRVVGGEPEGPSGELVCLGKAISGEFPSVSEWDIHLWKTYVLKKGKLWGQRRHVIWEGKQLKVSFPQQFLI